MVTVATFGGTYCPGATPVSSGSFLARAARAPSEWLEASFQVSRPTPVDPLMSSPTAKHQSTWPASAAARPAVQFPRTAMAAAHRPESLASIQLHSTAENVDDSLDCLELLDYPPLSDLIDDDSESIFGENVETKRIKTGSVAPEWGIEGNGPPPLSNGNGTASARQSGGLHSVRGQSLATTLSARRRLVLGSQMNAMLNNFDEVSVGAGRGGSADAIVNPHASKFCNVNNGDDTATELTMTFADAVSGSPKRIADTMTSMKSCVQRGGPSISYGCSPTAYAGSPISPAGTRSPQKQDSIDWILDKDMPLSLLVQSPGPMPEAASGHTFATCLKRKRDDWQSLIHASGIGWNSDICQFRANDSHEQQCRSFPDFRFVAVQDPPPRQHHVFGSPVPDCAVADAVPLLDKGKKIHVGLSAHCFKPEVTGPSHVCGGSSFTPAQMSAPCMATAVMRSPEPLSPLRRMPCPPSSITAVFKELERRKLIVKRGTDSVTLTEHAILVKMMLADCRVDCVYSSSEITNMHTGLTDQLRMKKLRSSGRSATQARRAVENGHSRRYNEVLQILMGLCCATPYVQNNVKLLRVHMDVDSYFIRGAAQPKRHSTAGLSSSPPMSQAVRMEPDSSTAVSARMNEVNMAIRNARHRLRDAKKTLATRQDEIRKMRAIINNA